MTMISNKRVVREFEALADGGSELDRLDTLCDPNIVNHALAAGRSQGIDGTRQFLKQARRITHRAHWLSSHMIAEDDLVVHFGTREHEWPGGSFRGFDLAPARYTRDVMFAYRLRGGRIVERWAIRDLAMIVQLGNLTSNSYAARVLEIISPSGLNATSGNWPRSQTSLGLHPVAEDRKAADEKLANTVILAPVSSPGQPAAGGRWS